MILSKNYLVNLIKQGKAQYACGPGRNNLHNCEKGTLIAVDRLDIQRRDYYFVTQTYVNGIRSNV